MPNQFSQASNFLLREAESLRLASKRANSMFNFSFRSTNPLSGLVRSHGLIFVMWGQKVPVLLLFAWRFTRVPFCLLAQQLAGCCV